METTDAAKLQAALSKFDCLDFNQSSLVSYEEIKTAMLEGLAKGLSIAAIRSKLEENNLQHLKIILRANHRLLTTLTHAQITDINKLIDTLEGHHEFLELHLLALKLKLITKEHQFAQEAISISTTDDTVDSEKIPSILDMPEYIKALETKNTLFDDIFKEEPAFVGVLPLDSTNRGDPIVENELTLNAVPSDELDTVEPEILCNDPLHKGVNTKVTELNHAIKKFNAQKKSIQTTYARNVIFVNEEIQRYNDGLAASYESVLEQRQLLSRKSSEINDTLNALKIVDYRQQMINLTRAEIEKYELRAARILSAVNNVEHYLNRASTECQIYELDEQQRTSVAEIFNTVSPNNWKWHWFKNLQVVLAVALVWLVVIAETILNYPAFTELLKLKEFKRMETINLWVTVTFLFVVMTIFMKVLTTTIEQVVFKKPDTRWTKVVAQHWFLILMALSILISLSLLAKFRVDVWSESLRIANTTADNKFELLAISILLGLFVPITAVFWKANTLNKQPINDTCIGIKTELIKLSGQQQ